MAFPPIRPHVQASAVLAATLAVALLTLSGCANPYGVGARASLDFKGTGAGTHDQSGSCGSTATLNGNGKIADGQVTIRATDAGGDEKFSKTFNADFTLSDQSLSGASGTWKIEASRAGNDVVGDSFNGEYHFSLYC